jgi:hypothetical protein
VTDGACPPQPVNVEERHFQGRNLARHRAGLRLFARFVTVKFQTDHIT